MFTAIWWTSGPSTNKLVGFERVMVSLIIKLLALFNLSCSGKDPMALIISQERKCRSSRSETVILDLELLP